MIESEPPECPICGAATRPTFACPSILYEPDHPRAFTLFHCESCDFSLMWPRPTSEELRRYYGPAYYTHQVNASPAESPQAPSLAARIRMRAAWAIDWSRQLDSSMVARWLGPPPARYCDIGCGSGELLSQVQGLGYEVIGVEPDDRARATATSRGVEVLAGGMGNLPPSLSRRSFDVVSFVHVLEHCNDPIGALTEAADLVRPGGSIIIEVPNNDCLLARRRGPAFWHRDIGRHVNFFSPRSLSAACRKAGLETIDCGYYGFTVQFADWRYRDERSLHESYRQLAGSEAMRPYRVPSPRGGWLELVRAGLSAPGRKYEAVRIVARVSSN